MRNILFAVFLGMLVIGLSGCGSEPPDPLPELIKEFKDQPTLSIILDDMKEEGDFLVDYYNKYRVVIPGKADPKADKAAVKAKVTDWLPVPENAYRRREPFLGMTLYSRQDGVPSNQVGPAGYEYVGNPRYGEWRRDSSGNSFWHFFAAYSFMNMMTGNRTVYRNDYDRYRSYGKRGRPYYGPRDRYARPAYGTQGTTTARQKPNFYKRRMARQSASKSAFGSRVNNRIGRSRVGVRGRSRSFGK